MRRRLAAVESGLRRRGRRLLARSPRPVAQLWRLAVRTARRAGEHRVPGLAAEAALFTVISLPALLLALIGALGFIAGILGTEGSRQLRRLVFDAPESALSARTYASYEPVARAVLEQTHGSVVSVGIVVAVWTGSRAINRYLETITIAYGVPPRRGWRRRLLALTVTVAGLLGAVALLPPMVIGPRLIRWMTPEAVAETTLSLLDRLFWPAVVVILVGVLTTLYHLGVPWRTPWRRDVPGAVLAMTVFLLAAAALRVYLDFNADDEVFRLLAAPIAVVLWLYLAALAVLLGAELNATIEQIWPTSSRPPVDQGRSR
ncbi:membrane protein [Mycolicibacterium murale]|uniref:Membrane protein n=1 Tax=Mycolicibacterium murale TaxID=182220 RepID=A0A7I9WVS3_9MYCO|nr:YhjD/YihY/BrkB family envelope integrity protein [Mycolicibacterium murale]GFG61781.1 membrane protein [Mycolicibacterium murale]